jgi:hypothetical protein
MAQGGESRLGKTGFTCYLEGKAREDFERFFEELNAARLAKGLPAYSKTYVAQVALIRLVNSHRNEPRQLDINFGPDLEP